MKSIVRKSIIIFISLVLILTALSGCQKTTGNDTNLGNVSDTSGQDEKPSEKGETGQSGTTKVVVGIGGDPGTLAPWGANNIGRIAVLPSIYQTLYMRDGFGGKMMPVLASDYEVVDKVNYYIHIYKNIVDHAGNPIKASDVVFSYNKARDLAGRIGTKIKAYIESIEAIDDYTVLFRFKSDPLEVLDLLADMFTNVYIVSEASYNAAGDGMASKPIGTGHYRLKNLTSGSSLILEKVEPYWQTDESKMMRYYKANVDIIEYHFITEKSQMTIALQTGTVDMTNFVAEADLVHFQTPEAQDKFKVLRVPQNLTYYMLPNCSPNSPLNNLKLRLAVMHCVNVDNIIKAAFNGNAVRVYTFGNSKFPDYQKEWQAQPYFDYDIEKAKQYLNEYFAETGKTHADLSLRILVANESYQQLVAELVQASILQLGIDAKLMVNDQATAEELVKDPAAWDLRVGQMAGGESIAYVWASMLDKNSSSGKMSVGFIDNENLQKQIELCLTEAGHTPENMNTLQKYIIDNAYVRGLVQGFDTIVHAKHIKDVVIDQRINILPGACTYDWSLKKDSK